MKNLFFTNALFFISVLCFGQQTTTIEFDGVVDPQEWKGANTFTIAYEMDPGFNTPAVHPTEVFVTYDREHLLVGFIAYTDMSTLRSSIRNRDEAWSDDFVMFGIDTYKDGRYMINFGSNAEGNQLDMKINSNGNDDESYDVTYYTKASKQEDAYHVEMMIPFSVLQFEEKEVMNWNIIMYRSTYSGDTRTQNLNFALDRENPCFVCQTPHQLNLQNVKSKNRVTLLPNVFSGIDASRNGDRLSYGKMKMNFGLSGLIDINNTTSLEYAINPDFSQVEADVSQISVNNTFGIQYPERRPYFNEGKDIIQSYIETVYTRSINKPIMSSKLINQGKKQRYYWLTAYDEKSPYLVGGENESYVGAGTESVANIFRYQRNFEGGSNLGFLTTNRFYSKGGSGNTFGVDGLFRIKKSYTIGFEINNSLVVEPEADWIESDHIIEDKTVALDGERNNGYAALVYVGRSSKHWNTDIYYVEKSPWYSTPLGFATQNNYKTLNIKQGYQHFFEESSTINTLNATVMFFNTDNFYGLNKASQLRGQLFMALDKNISLEVSHQLLFNEEFYGFNAKNNTENSLFMRYNPNEKINIGGYVSKGRVIYRDSENPAVGESVFVETFNTFQISPKLSISPSLRYAKLAYLNSDELYYKGHIFRGNLNYQFNKDISLRVIVEKNDFDDTWFMQSLLKYNPNPFTIFYVGGSSGYSYVEQNSNYQADTSQIYFKFQYMFDL